MNFRGLISKYASGNLPVELLPEVGMAGLAEGLDTPSLCILAGLDDGENSFVKVQYFEHVLRELNIQMPGKRQASLQYALALTDEMISGSKELIEGLQEITTQAIKNYKGFWLENKIYVYDSIGFEALYGLYDEYGDMLDPTEDELNDLKIEIYKALIKWREKLEVLSTRPN